MHHNDTVEASDATLTEDLWCLFRAARIRSPWLPGMLIHDPSFPDLEGDRIVNVQYPGAMPGDPVQFTSAFCRVATPSDPEGDREWIGREYRLVLSDPATVGCLVALFREATGDPDARASYHKTYSNDLYWWTLGWKNARIGRMESARVHVQPGAPDGEALALAAGFRVLANRERSST